MRDDIRSDYNAMYPINAAGKRGEIGKPAPDLATFTKSWLKQNNIDENQFFNNSGQINPKPDADKKVNPEYAEYLRRFNAAKTQAEKDSLTKFAKDRGIAK